MYNIHSHYENIFSSVIHLVDSPGVFYLFPFGTTDIKNVEIIGAAESKVLFLCYDQEPLLFDYNKNLFLDISYNKHTYVKSKDLSQTIFSEVHQQEIFTKLVIPAQIISSPIILLNTERESEEKNKILAEFNFIDCYYFFHALAAADWYRGYEYCKDLLSPKIRKINKKFISFNRITGNSRIYRSLFVAELQKLELIQHGHVSYSRDCPVHGHYKYNLILAKNKYNLSNDYITQVINLLDNMTHPLRIDFKKSTIIQNDSQTIGPIKELMESFLHVVTETCFWEKKQHLTEKIFKPIVAKQPFVLLGCTNNLKYLQSYGFRTFDRWWDESYDQCQDPIQRITMVTKIIEDICKRSNQELQDLLIEMEEVLEHNYNRFYSKEFVQEIWNELETNLRSAVAQLLLPTSVKM